MTRLSTTSNHKKNMFVLVILELYALSPTVSQEGEMLTILGWLTGWDLLNGLLAEKANIITFTRIPELKNTKLCRFPSTHYKNYPSIGQRYIAPHKVSLATHIHTHISWINFIISFFKFILKVLHTSIIFVVILL